MSAHLPDDPGRPRFLADRMLGTLTRYLRFMGYDTRSASDLPSGNPAEDTVLLGIAREEGRILLTRDRALARRGGEGAIYLDGEDAATQLCRLIARGLVNPVLAMDRCSLCNTPLRPAAAAEVAGAVYAPPADAGYEFHWCVRCGKLYWMGSHGRRLAERFQNLHAKGDRTR
jgi:uncharacterized protein with PIN domain